MRSYRIVIEYTDASTKRRDHPEHWDWQDLLASEVDEAVSLVSVTKISTPAGHKEDIEYPTKHRLETLGDPEE